MPEPSRRAAVSGPAFQKAAVIAFSLALRAAFRLLSYSLCAFWICSGVDDRFFSIVWYSLNSGATVGQLTQPVGRN